MVTMEDGNLPMPHFMEEEMLLAQWVCNTTFVTIEYLLYIIVSDALYYV